ncbi:MAG: AraC family transcriptional regulator [Bacteroidota bacterium]
MLQNIDYTDNVSQLKEDDSLFSEEFPYMLWRKNYEGIGEEIMLHYHESFEIIASERLEGERIIEGQKFSLSGSTIFVIPPGALHSATIESNHGKSIILKFSIDALSRFINIKNIFSTLGIGLNQVPFTSEYYPELTKHIKTLEEADVTDIFNKLGIFTSLFRSIHKSCISEGAATKDISMNIFAHNNKIRKIIDWTNKNYEKKIYLDEAAQHVGLSKIYFCKYFKKITNNTYLNYVNQVKIEKATKLLLEGESVTEASYSCGFSNISYFIQLFRKVKGVTPTKYVKDMLA